MSIQKEHGRVILKKKKKKKKTNMSINNGSGR